MIFLTGLPGAGKSSVGSELATRLGREFIDLDERIVASAGLSIPEIFQRHGESGFRRLEAAELCKVARGEQAVVALGGGTLMDSDNLRWAKSRGTLVYLAAPIDLLCERLGSPDGRPLFNGATTREAVRSTLRDLWNARRESYERADVVVWSGVTSSIERVAAQIAERLAER